MLAERLFAFLVSSAISVPLERPPPPLPPRASGLVSEVRRLPGGAEVVSAVLAGRSDVEALARFVEALRFEGCPPALLHHLALFFAKVAMAIEHVAPEAAATAWVRSLAAWLALAEERAYLSQLEVAVLGDAARRTRAVASAGTGELRSAREPRDIGISPERVPLELLADLARRAEAAARDLAPSGKAALLALSRTDEAARIAGASQAASRQVRADAERRRNGVIEAALGVIGEALDAASVRAELTTAGRDLLIRAISVWTWTSKDEAVEHFVIDRIDKLAWELYRAREWDALRHLLEPFWPMFDSLATRIESDPSHIAYAAGCAQMFVFLSEVEPVLERKIELAERAVRVCPTHRNGRLVLASFLCVRAMDSLRKMSFFTQKSEIDYVAALIARAESLNPRATEIEEAKAILERVKRVRRRA